MISKLWRILLPLLLFLLPWQTRWMYDPRFLNGSYWEYGSASWYVTEILLWIIIILFFADLIRSRNVSHLFGKFHWQSCLPDRQAHRRNFFLTLAFFVFLCTEVLHSMDIGISFNYFFLLLEGLCLFIVITSIEKTRPLLLAFWAGGVIQALLGAYQFFTQNISANKWFGLALQTPFQPGSFMIESGSERWLRAYGGFGSPNILGGYLAVIFILGLLMYLDSRPWHKIFLTLGQVIILVGLIFSFSRSAYLAVLFGWMFVGIFLLAKKHRFFNRLHLVGMYIKQSIFYLLVLIVIFFNFQFLFTARLNLSDKLENTSVSERVGQYSDVAGLFHKHPFLGVGPGAYTLALYRADPYLHGYSYQPVHNIYVLILTEWGILGALVWLAIFIWLISLVRALHPEFLPLVMMPFIIGVFDHYWWSLYAGIIIWWVVFGLSLGYNDGNLN